MAWDERGPGGNAHRRASEGELPTGLEAVKNGRAVKKGRSLERKEIPGLEGSFTCRDLPGRAPGRGN